MSELYPMPCLSESEDDEMTDSNEIANQVLGAIQNGATLKDIYGISDHVMDTMYACAYDYYQKGRLNDAEVFFRFLCTHNVYNAEYIFGLAAVLQRKHEYSKAAHMFRLSSVINVSDYRAVFQAGLCYLNLKDKQQARNCFAEVAENNAPEKLKKQAQSYLAAIKPDQI